jgi:hypothetical protein
MLFSRPDNELWETSCQAVWPYKKPDRKKLIPIIYLKLRHFFIYAARERDKKKNNKINMTAGGVFRKEVILMPVINKIDIIAITLFIMKLLFFITRKSSSVKKIN